MGRWRTHHTLRHRDEGEEHGTVGRGQDPHCQGYVNKYHYLFDLKLLITVFIQK